MQINLLNEREMPAMLRLMTTMADKRQIGDAALAEARAFAHNTDPMALLDPLVAAGREARQAT